MRHLIFTIGYLLCTCSLAWATQEHADPEGLYSHQIAHIFFMCSMVILIVQIKKSATKHPGWVYIGISALLFLFWNVNVFVVHWIRELITADLFSGPSSSWFQTIDISSFNAKIFYIGKITDHLLSVSAVLVFLLGIRKFKEREQAENE